MEYLTAFVTLGTLAIWVCPGVVSKRSVGSNESEKTAVTEATIVIENDDSIHSSINYITEQYFKDANERWKLSADSGVWGLVFDQFETEYSVSCEHDYLQIDEIANSSLDEAVPPTRYCGSVKPHPYISKHPELDIHFVSDSVWEMKGFVIKVLHADNLAALEEKIIMYKNSPAAPTPQPQKNDRPAPSDDGNGPLLYALIGSASAAMIIFIIMLSYCVISMRRKKSSRPPQLPVVYYKSRTQQCGPASLSQPSIVYCRSKTGNQHGGTSSQSQPPLAYYQSNTGKQCSRGQDTAGSASIAVDLRKIGKRYSKDKNSNKMTGNTLQKLPAELDNAQHNNLYVAYSTVQK